MQGTKDGVNSSISSSFPASVREPVSDTGSLPVTVIEAGERWFDLRLHDLWNFRELLFFLVWRDVKVRYKQTALGAAWAVLQPLLAMLVFTLLFGRLAKLPSD